MSTARLEWLQAIHSIAVNGRHAIFLAERMVRLEMLRSGRSWELAITLHALSPVPDRVRPQIISMPIFRGRDGVPSVDLWREKYRQLRGTLTPMFYSRAGEVLAFPLQFEEAVRKITVTVCCIGCEHVHLGVPPAGGDENIVVMTQKMSGERLP